MEFTNLVKETLGISINLHSTNKNNKNKYFSTFISTNNSICGNINLKKINKLNIFSIISKNKFTKFENIFNYKEHNYLQKDNTFNYLDYNKLYFLDQIFYYYAHNEYLFSNNYLNLNSNLNLNNMLSFDIFDLNNIGNNSIFKYNIKTFYNFNIFEYLQISLNKKNYQNVEINLNKKDKINKKEKKINRTLKYLIYKFRIINQYKSIIKLSNDGTVIDNTIIYGYFSFKRYHITIYIKKYLLDLFSNFFYINNLIYIIFNYFVKFNTLLNIIFFKISNIPINFKIFTNFRSKYIFLNKKYITKNDNNIIILYDKLFKISNNYYNFKIKKLFSDGVYSQNIRYERKQKYVGADFYNIFKLIHLYNTELIFIDYISNIPVFKKFKYNVIFKYYNYINIHNTSRSKTNNLKINYKKIKVM